MRHLPILLTVLLTAQAAQAAGLSGAPATTAPEPAGVIAPETPLTAPLDQAVDITLPRPISRVAVGSEDVVSVVPMGARKLVISGRKFGLTNLLVYDDANTIMYSRMISVPATRPNSISVYNGSTKHTLVCTPLCEEVAATAPATPAAASPAPAAGPTP
jgi:Flp pilus assembly secretin CpaC